MRSSSNLTASGYELDAVVQEINYNLLEPAAKTGNSRKILWYLKTQNVKHSRLTYGKRSISHISLVTNISSQSNATSTIADTMNLD